MGFLNSFKLPFQPMFGDGKNIRSISHCDDIVSAFVLAESSDAAVSKWYWLPSLTMSVNDIYGMVSESFGRQCKPVRAPNFVCSLLARADKILVNRFGHLHPTLHAAGKFHRTIATNAAGREPAKHDFGWEPSVTRAQIQKEIAKAVS
jgi:nucleoside-diphosphate-sugar epimerase